ncbi:MAG TPA: hypothetical protein VK039_03170, partial [Brevibacterium sp.]|nr:hypothetical protein [Brevibacterium sp.]
MRNSSFRLSRGAPGSPPTRRPRRLLAAVTAIGALLLGIAGAAPAAADEPADLGPTLIKTDVAPTGYSVKFRYEAPADVDQVHLYGDWTYSKPENVTCDGCGDGRL